jgi:MFS transporter, DHA2 family, multidrug resistance protein
MYINLLHGPLLAAMIWYGMDDQPMRPDRLRNGDWFGILSMAIGLGSLEVVLERASARTGSAIR